MLAILMGLIAWVLDALISWHFFPGKSFFQMLFAYDPERTLYVRSSVVILFFIFGLVAGRLVAKFEVAQAKFEESLNLLQGARTLHDQIVQSRHEQDFLKSSLPLLEKTFHLHSLCFFAVEGSFFLRTREIGDFGECDGEWLRKEVDEQLKQFSDSTTLVWLKGGAPPGSFLTPIRLGDRVFGMMYGRSDAGKAFKTTDQIQHFLSACDNIGHALAFIQDHENLTRNAEKLKELYNSAPVGIFTTTIGGSLKFANPAMADFLGSESTEKLLESNINVSSLYVDSSRRDDFIGTLVNDGYIADFEVELKKLDGSVRTILLAGRLNRDADQEDALIEGFAMDITASKTAEQKNRILQKELSKSQHLKSITVLAGGVAHEFNNILQVMMGSAYLAQMKYSHQEDEVGKYLQDIQNNGKRAAKLCDQMLSYAGKKAMFLKSDYPEEALTGILKLIVSNIGPSVTIEKEFTAPSAQVRMDIPAFSEIVNQLVTNSVESFSHGKGEIKITTRATEFSTEDFSPYQMSRKLNPDDYWELKIKDNGSGISDADLPHIFEPFFTTKFQGRGLGLPAISGLIEKFDGSLGVRKRSEGGTEVAVWFPLARAVLVEEAPPEQTVSVKEEPFHGTGKIWVVDDEPLICMTLERLLTRLGFEVGTANDGAEALEAIRKENAEELRCLIFDVTMPRMGGFETLQKVREFLPDIPVLIMSGYDESESLTNFESLNVAGFIHKPFRMEQLQVKIKEILS